MHGSECIIVLVMHARVKGVAFNQDTTTRAQSATKSECKSKMSSNIDEITALEL